MFTKRGTLRLDWLKLSKGQRAMKIVVAYGDRGGRWRERGYANPDAEGITMNDLSIVIRNVSERGASRTIEEQGPAYHYLDQKLSARSKRRKINQAVRDVKRKRRNHWFV